MHPASRRDVPALLKVVQQSADALRERRLHRVVRSVMRGLVRSRRKRRVRLCVSLRLSCEEIPVVAV